MTTTLQPAAQPDEASLKHALSRWLVGKLPDRFFAIGTACALVEDTDSPLRPILDANEALRRDLADAEAERDDAVANSREPVGDAWDEIRRLEGECRVLIAEREAERRGCIAWQARAEALQRERDEARDLAYELKLAAAGGEDVPGSAHAVTVADVKRWTDERCQEARHSWDRAEAASALAARVPALEAALSWYGEQARLCRLIHSEGDAGRHALNDDGGKRARAVLSTEGGSDAQRG